MKKNRKNARTSRDITFIIMQKMSKIITYKINISNPRFFYEVTKNQLIECGRLAFGMLYRSCRDTSRMCGEKNDHRKMK